MKITTEKIIFGFCIVFVCLNLGLIWASGEIKKEYKALKDENNSLIISYNSEKNILTAKVKALTIENIELEHSQLQLIRDNSYLSSTLETLTEILREEFEKHKWCPLH
ncbi:hypothetical protein N9955_00380 [bacterium]|nr:hypothetical protein [bacterium]